MKSMEFCRAVGSMEQLAYVREVRDLASGQRLVEVENGRLRFTVLPDRGLDIASLRFDGKNMSFMAKAGLQHEKSTDILGGLFFTCGPDNVGPAENGLPMHGSFRNTSAEHLGTEAFWRDTSMCCASAEACAAQPFSAAILRCGVPSKPSMGRPP